MCRDVGGFDFSLVFPPQSNHIHEMSVWREEGRECLHVMPVPSVHEAGRNVLWSLSVCRHICPPAPAFR
jgi:hypothetical protein